MLQYTKTIIVPEHFATLQPKTSVWVLCNQPTKNTLLPCTGGIAEIHSLDKSLLMGQSCITTIKTFTEDWQKELWLNICNLTCMGHSTNMEEDALLKWNHI